jgi:hypothetical protein
MNHLVFKGFLREEQGSLGGMEIAIYRSQSLPIGEVNTNAIIKVTSPPPVESLRVEREEEGRVGVAGKIIAAERGMPWE